MEVIDISWTFSQSMTSYKDDAQKKLVRTPTKATGSWISESLLQFGTHVDAPVHFLEKGSSIDKVSLETFVGNCRVLDFSNVSNHIAASDLQEKSLREGEIILLKTKNSNKSETDLFDKDFIYLEKSGAEFLAEKKVKAVG